MNWLMFSLVAVGGAIGSVARAIAGTLIPTGWLPWATISVNVSGSLLIGWLVGRQGPLTPENLRVYSFWVIGVCGGFTTFSSFSVQTLQEMQKGNWAAATTNVVLSVGVCLFATWLGWRLAR